MKFVDRIVVLGVLTLFAATAPAQEEEQGKNQVRGEQVKTLVGALAKKGITVDLAAKTIAIKALVNPSADPLEYLLIHRRGKGHEALFVTEVKPSLLNSAFLLLGLEKGKNATYKQIEPPPTEEEIEKGADWVKVFPPEGSKVYMTVRWKDAKTAKFKTAAVEDLIIDLTTQKPLAACDWIFLGGRMAAMYRNEPPVFMADYEGNLISICYLAPANHLVTMRHERARDDQNWWMTEVCPKPDTEVEFRFHLNKPEVVVERDKRLAAEKDRKPAGDKKDGVESNK